MFSIFIDLLLLSTTFVTGTENSVRNDLSEVRDLNQRAPFSSPDPDQWFFADPRSCSQFIACNDGICTVLLCVGGRYYNPEIKWCDHKENVKCTIEHSDNQESAENIADTECPSNGQYHYPYPGVCTKFIQCYDGRYSVIDCANGFIFNPDGGFCDYSENITCEDSISNSTTTTSSTITDETTTSTTTTESTTTEDPNANGGPVGTCPAVNGQSVDFLTDSKDCSVYYMCNWGTPIKNKCGSGLHFNPTLKVCDWPSSAGCTVK